MSKKFFSGLLAVAALFIFSSVSLAQTSSAHPKKARIVTRGKVEVAPKRKIPVSPKKVRPASRTTIKKSVRNVATPKKAKVKEAAMKKAPRSFFWKMALNPVAMMVWIPLLLTGIVVVVQLFRLLPRREPEEFPGVVQEEAAEDESSWDQRAWNRIKEFFRRFWRKPALASL